MRALLTGITTRASVSSAGAGGNRGSWFPSISADGRIVAFFSGSSNLAPNDTDGIWDVFVHDRVAGTTELVSVDSAAVKGNNSSVYPSISANGHLVAFESKATNLVPGDTNGQWDVFLHDRLTGITSRVSVDSAGAQANAYCRNASISSDGYSVAFESLANNLVPTDTNKVPDVFVHR